MQEARPTETTPATILEAASHRFARFGPRKTTMGEIARDAGCSRATVYLHYPSKEALYAGLLERETERFIAEVETSIAPLKSARAKLRRMVEVASATYARNQLLRHAAARDEQMTLVGVARMATRTQEARIIGILRRLLEQGVAEGSLRRVDPAAAAYVLYHFGSVLVVQEAAGTGAYPLAQVLGVMDDLFNHGIAKERATGARRKAR